MVQPRPSAPVKAKKKSSVHFGPKKIYKDANIKFVPSDSLKNHLNILMFGISGSGKSTLCGELMIQMGHLKKSEINKVVETRHLVDVIDAERKLRHSIETAKVTISDEESVFTILDTPGKYLNEFLRFAPLAEVAIMVVSAKDKIFDHEKLKIAKGLGIRELIVVVNKMDTVKWAKSNFLDIKESLEPMIKEAGFLLANT